MIPIEKLKIGDVVLSYDENDNPAPSVIIRMSKRWTTDIMSINSGWSNAIRMTRDHLVKTHNGYIKAGELTTEDQVLHVWKCSMTQESKKVSSERMSKQNPMKDPVTVSKQLESLSKWWTPERRTTKSMAYKGRKGREEFPDEERKAKSERMKNNNPMKNPITAAKVAAIERAQFASGERKSPHLYKYGMGNYSDGQQKLYDILDSMEVVYEKEFSVKATEGCPNKCRVYLDAAIPEQKVNIEYDGFPYHSFKHSKNHDILRDAWLKENGWIILRIAGDDIQNQTLMKEKIDRLRLSNNSRWNKIHKISKYDIIDANGRNMNSQRSSGWVYDIETNPNHNFVVGNQKTRGGIVVHNCNYCFANNIMRTPDRNFQKFRSMKECGTMYNEWPIRSLEKLLARERKDKFALSIYPMLDAGMPVQLGALGDPLDDLELVSGWLLKAIPIFIKYKIPVRVSTKGADVMMRKEYRDLFHRSPEQFWIAFSLITPSDEKLAEIDVGAPSATARLEAMKAYSQSGHPTSLRYRPFIPGISDSVPGEPEAWRVLLEKTADAGARAVSFEYIFLQKALTDRQKVMYHRMFKTAGNPKFGDWWNANSQQKEACRRGSRTIKYEQTMKIYNKTHELGMTFGISDPHFKELNDSGCCCGILPDHKWFGGWSRRQLTNVIYEMRQAFDRGERLRVNFKDWSPEWAEQIYAGSMIAYGGAHAKRIRKFHTFGDTMRSKWNDPTHPRSPFTYFGGVMRPVGLDENTNDLVYEYRGWHEKFNPHKEEVNSIFLHYKYKEK